MTEQVKVVFLKNEAVRHAFKHTNSSVDRIEEFENAVEVVHEDGEVLHIPDHNIAAVKYFSNDQEDGEKQ